MDKTIVFCQTKRTCDRVERNLQELGVRAAAIHGDLAQAARERALKRFTDGELAVLVATDVAARGIDIDDIGAVIHYEPAGDVKDYLHRSGRTARAGRDGWAITLAEYNQHTQVRILQRAMRLEPAPPIEVFSNNPKLKRPQPVRSRNSRTRSLPIATRDRVGADHRGRRQHQELGSPATSSDRCASEIATSTGPWATERAVRGRASRRPTGALVSMTATEAVQHDHRHAHREDALEHGESCRFPVPPTLERVGSVRGEDQHDEEDEGAQDGLVTSPPESVGQRDEPATFGRHRPEHEQARRLRPQPDVGVEELGRVDGEPDPHAAVPTAITPAVMARCRSLERTPSRPTGAGRSHRQSGHAVVTTKRMRARTTAGRCPRTTSDRR